MVSFRLPFAVGLSMIVAASVNAQTSLPIEKALREDAEATGGLAPFEPMDHAEAVAARPAPDGYEIVLDGVEPEMEDSTRDFIRGRIDRGDWLTFYGALATGDVSHDSHAIGMAFGAHRLDGAETYAMAQCERLRGDFSRGLPCRVIARVLPIGANDPEVDVQDIVPMNNLLASVLPDIEGFVESAGGDFAVAVSRGGSTATYAGGPDAGETAVADCNHSAAAALWIKDCYLFTVQSTGDVDTTPDQVPAPEAETQSEAGEDAGLTAPPEGSRSTPEAILGAFLKDHGQDFEACFTGLPEMQGPGDVARYETARAIEAGVRRMILAVDASGSMAGQFGGQTKMQAASTAADGFLGSTPDDVEVGLVAFGHTGSNDDAGKAESCAGVETLVPLGADRAAVSEEIAELQPTGWTPLASAIEAAAAQLTPSESGEQVVYIVSDGEETCDGDPIRAARDLVDSELKAVVNILGFDLEEADRTQLQAVAEAGGGAFVEADPDTNILRMLEELRVRGDNTNARVDAVADAANRGTENNAAMSNALTDMRACVANTRLAELEAVFPWFTETHAGEYDRVTREQVETLLDDRHDEFAAREKALSERGEAAYEAAQEEIDASREATEQGFRDAQREEADD